MAYSGSGALKTDFTRTGKRTKRGALRDFNNSLMRYVKNNYFDGPRQDAFDLVTGAWVPRGPSSAYALFFDPRPLFTRAVRDSSSHTRIGRTNAVLIDALCIVICHLYDINRAHTASSFRYACIAKTSSIRSRYTNIY